LVPRIIWINTYLFYHLLVFQRPTVSAIWRFQCSTISLMSHSVNFKRQQWKWKKKTTCLLLYDLPVTLVNSVKNRLFSIFFRVWKVFKHFKRIPCTPVAWSVGPCDIDFDKFPRLSHSQLFYFMIFYNIYKHTLYVFYFFYAHIIFGIRVRSYLLCRVSTT